MEIRGEANLGKLQIDKVVDKIIVGVNKEENTTHLHYQDNRQIQITLPLPEEIIKSITSPILEERIRKIVEAQVQPYKKELERLHSELKKLNEQMVAASIIAASGVSIQGSLAYITTGNATEIKIVEKPPKIQFL